MKALDVECPYCGVPAGVMCYVMITRKEPGSVGGFSTFITNEPQGHAHGGRSRLVAIRATLQRAEHLALDSEADRRALETSLMEALS